MANRYAAGGESVKEPVVGIAAAPWATGDWQELPQGIVQDGRPQAACRRWRDPHPAAEDPNHRAVTVACVAWQDVEELAVPSGKVKITGVEIQW